MSSASRAKAAVLGALVADAASMPLHWIYDMSKMKELLAGNGKESAPEFYDPPSCPFYQRENGLESPYGAEAFALLKSIAEKGAVDGPSIVEFYYNFFKSYDGRNNHTIDELIKAYDEGMRFPETGDAEDYQANSFVKVPPVVARYAGSPDLVKKIEEAVRTQQNNDASVSAAIGAALILEKVVLGSSVSDALEWAKKDTSVSEAVTDIIEKALAAKDQDYGAVVWDVFGPSCVMPGSMAAAINAAVKFPSFQDAVRANIVAGGDNCSRAHLIGALLAAEGGEDSIPEEWKAKTTAYAEISALADKIIAQQ